MTQYIKDAITDDFVQAYIKQHVIVSDISECWDWQKRQDKHGYGIIWGKIRFHYGTNYIHRISYLVFNGAIDTGLLIRHRCNNTRCCNPNHLIPGTDVENGADRAEPISERTDAALRNMEQTLKIQLAEVQAELQKRGFDI